MAFAFVLIIEGAGPLLFPRRWKNYIMQLSQQPLSLLRQIGGVMVTIGLMFLFFMQ
ncbi:DUF2065 domain-containing protein [Paraneptunicella aestuarii]|nr:DUF2065 domain-containing protein [Paraneptunicella aestuarii]